MLKYYLLLILMTLTLTDDKHQRFTLPSESTQNWNIKANRDKTIVLIMKGNPTTGFSWLVEDPKKIDKTILEPLNINKFNTADDYVSDPHEQGMVGYGGNFHFKFRPLKEGKTSIKFLYKQPWMPNSAYEVNVDITIE